jgi:hypothetical protein
MHAVSKKPKIIPEHTWRVLQRPSGGVYALGYLARSRDADCTHVQILSLQLI